MVMPSYVDMALQLDLSIIFILALLALSMSFLWGYAGMLSFGQTAFFGLGGYSYAVLSLNAGVTHWPFVAGHPVADAVRPSTRLFHDLRPDQRHLPRA